MIERERRREGPINGRIGYVLAVVRQFTPLFGWVGVLFILFGFQLSSPGKQISQVTTQLATIAERFDQLESYVVALVRLRCSEIDSRQARLSGLNCEALR